jgi:hypothetical protein
MILDSAAIIALMSVSGSASAMAPRKTLQTCASDQDSVTYSHGKRST